MMDKRSAKGRAEEEVSEQSLGPHWLGFAKSFAKPRL